MAENTLKIAGAAGAALLFAAGGTVAIQAQAAPSPQPATEAAAAAVAAPAVKTDVVEGGFSFTQAEVTPTDLVASRMGGAAQVLCGSAWSAGPGEAPCDAWRISVTGDVRDEVRATMGELAEEGGFHAVMGCSCAGNGADGLASVNAEVAGVTVAYLLEAAGASEDANTVVFVSDDGYEVALPLAYVAQRPSMVVYALNGEELSGSVGGANQLWLGSTSARYFARNVVEVRVEVRDEADVPPVPGSPEAGDAYANVPNIAVVFGGEAN